MQTQIVSKVDNKFSTVEVQQQPQVISVVSTKGGVGKTTLSANLSAALADMRFRVLMIDADVQPSLSKYYPLHKTAENGIVEFLLGDNSDENIISCISKTIYPNLDIVLSNNITGDIQTKIQQRLDRSVLIKNKLQYPAITKNYDFVIIDTQGSVGALQDAACFAADLLLSPMVPTILSAREFVSGTLDMISRLSQGESIGLRTPPLAGVIYAQSRTKDAKEVANEIRNIFNQFIDGKKRLLKTVVPNAKAYTESASLRVPVHCHDRFQTNRTECAYDIMHSLVYEICPPIAERQLEAACFVNGLLAEESLPDNDTLPENITQQNQDDSVENTTQNGSGYLNETPIKDHDSTPKHSGSLPISDDDELWTKREHLSDYVQDILSNRPCSHNIPFGNFNFEELNFPQCFFNNATLSEKQVSDAIRLIIRVVYPCANRIKVQRMLYMLSDKNTTSPFEDFIEICDKEYELFENQKTLNDESSENLRGE